MTAGLGLLRLSPADFWAMTPRELAAALDLAGRSGGGLSRVDLQRMIAAFPDSLRRRRVDG
jgi:uncharacterized phage protein (TIGR02216 family)